MRQWVESFADRLSAMAPNHAFAFVGSSFGPAVVASQSGFEQIKTAQFAMVRFTSAWP